MRMTRNTKKMSTRWTGPAACQMPCWCCAVVINWNVDINKNVIKEIDNPESVNSDQISDQGGQENLVEKGTVFYDEKTGKYYVRVE